MRRLTILAVGLAVLVLGTGTVAAQAAGAPDEVPLPEPPVDGPNVEDPDDMPGDGGAEAGTGTEPTAATNIEETNDTDVNGTDIEETNDTDVNGTDIEETNDTDVDGTESARGEAGDRGPPIEMPEQVPDHVTQIHEVIGSFLAGDLDGTLGSALQDVLGQQNDAGNGVAHAER